MKRLLIALFICLLPFVAKAKDSKWSFVSNLFGDAPVYNGVNVAILSAEYRSLMAELVKKNVIAFDKELRSLIDPDDLEFIKKHSEGIYSEDKSYIENAKPMDPNDEYFENLGIEIDDRKYYFKTDGGAIFKKKDDQIYFSSGKAAYYSSKYDIITMGYTYINGINTSKAKIQSVVHHEVQHLKDCTAMESKGYGKELMIYELDKTTKLLWDGILEARAYSEEAFFVYQKMKEYENKSLAHLSSSARLKACQLTKKNCEEEEELYKKDVAEAELYRKWYVDFYNIYNYSVNPEKIAFREAINKGYTPIILPPLNF